MELFTSIDIQRAKPCVIALGNFDGVHLAHRMLLNQGKALAEALKIDFSVLIFDPHPAKVLFPERPLQLISTCLSKEELFAQLGVDRTYRLPFTLQTAKMSGREFVTDIILPLQGKQLVVGFNYTFGARGAGDPQYLTELGHEYGFGVNVLQAQANQGGEIISSTTIRRALLAGDVDKGKKMLGSSPCLKGKVVSGEQRGRELGFPTANLQIPPDMLIPKRGVYAGWIFYKGKSYAGVMNIGMKPTFHNQYDQTVEVHLLDFAEDLYGEELAIHIEYRLRDERKFSGIHELKQQIIEDCINTHQLINDIL